MEPTELKPETAEVKKVWYRRFSVPVVVTAIILVLAFGVIALLLFIKNQPPTQRGIAPLIPIPAMEADSAVWGVNFPNQYSSFLTTATHNTRTDYGGSELVDKLEVDPKLKELFKGYGFGKSYLEDRGHMNSLTDVRASPRVNEKTPATCYSCKSADNPKLWAEMGATGFDKMAFSAMSPNIKNPIGCANCHEASTMRLIVTNPALEDALLAQGKDWHTFTRQEMRSLVCANCHVEYYMEGDGKLLVLPWKKGTNIEQIEAYYEEDKFSDWKHPDSQTDVVKMQHPEYELFTADSTHYQAGVSCADCHMPYLRDGSAKFSSHDVKSPLQDANRACGTCHTNVEYVTGRVKRIQEQTHATMMATEEALVAAIQAIANAAQQEGADAAKLDEARSLHRRAQLRWDFIAAENSTGFHNPEEALRILASATDMARQAQLLAFQAAAR